MDNIALFPRNVTHGNHEMFYIWSVNVYHINVTVDWISIDLDNNVLPIRCKSIILSNAELQTKYPMK